MKRTITESTFRDAFTSHDRGNSFSYEALGALFDFFEEMDDSCGTETELDVVAIDCEFAEYDTALECITTCGYGFEPDPDDDEDDQEEEALKYLRNNTTVLEFRGGIVIQNF